VPIGFAIAILTAAKTGGEVGVYIAEPVKDSTVILNEARPAPISTFAVQFSKRAAPVLGAFRRGEQFSLSHRVVSMPRLAADDA
jgi:hypothetical protein